MAGDVERELDRDLALLDAAERREKSDFRIWTTDHATVVIGRSVEINEEVEEQFCRTTGIGIVRRPSGGRSVMVGRGTVQYTFTLHHSVAAELASIAGAKSFCNRMLIAGLERATGLAPGRIGEDPSGDLIVNERKIAGLALRRCREATLLHGTILAHADIALIARALKPPRREPAYRAGRTHEQFLANVGTIDDDVLQNVVRKLLEDLDRTR